MTSWFNILRCFGLLLSTSLFMLGFFSIQLPDTEISESYPSNSVIVQELKKTNSTFVPYEEVVFPKKLIFIIIDALRDDFVFASNHFKFISEQAKLGEAMLFQANVQSPTVTMPRIKAMTTGTVPSFSDVILNLASPNIKLDNLLLQWKKINKKIWFFGDDTWLKLFPDVFNKAEGTTSFYVKDYTEVDDNVTRNIRPSIEYMEKWDILIMHYLGLDHIGHTFGPKSTLLVNKSIEMDHIIQYVYSSMKEVDDNFLMLIQGDHGMSELGGHGGASSAETTVAAILLSPMIHTPLSESISKLEQIDLVPILSVVTGTPIPSNSLGLLNVNVLKGLAFSPESILLSLSQNAHQLCKIDRTSKYTNDLDLLDAASIAALKSIEPRTDDTIISILINDYILVSAKLRSSLLNSRQTFNLPYMLIAMVISMLVLMSCLYGLVKGKQRDSFNDPSAILLIGCFITSLSLSSSSFVEEEHQTWYFMWSTFLVILFAQEMFRNNLRHLNSTRLILIGSLMCSHRIARAWIRTGVKWTNLTDFSDILAEPSNVFVCACVSVVSMLCTFAIVISTRTEGSLLLQSLVLLIGSASIYGHHWMANAFHSYVLLFPWVVYSLAGLRFSMDMTCSLILCIFLWCRPSMHPLILLIFISLKILKYLFSGQSNNYSAVIYTYANVVFYYMGNSNSLGTVDISVGYIGLRSYIPYFVGPVMFLYHYSGPLLTFSVLRRQQRNDRLKTELCKITLIRAFFVMSIIFVCYLHKYHIFVWSVFAPKLFYEFFHTCFLTGIMCYYI